MKERISDFSIGISVVAFALMGLIVLATLGAVFLLNGETLPQTPVILGPNR